MVRHRLGSARNLLQVSAPKTHPAFIGINKGEILLGAEREWNFAFYAPARMKMSCSAFMAAHAHLTMLSPGKKSLSLQI
jgi:hypothetical protein